jgi:hypothetical protein
MVDEAEREWRRGAGAFYARARKQVNEACHAIKNVTEGPIVAPFTM